MSEGNRDSYGGILSVPTHRYRLYYRALVSYLKEKIGDEPDKVLYIRRVDVEDFASEIMQEMFLYKDSEV